MPNTKPPTCPQCGAQNKAGGRRCPECSGARSRQNNQAKQPRTDRICDDCGDPADVPFRPRPSRTVYCKPCYASRQAAERPPSARRGGSRQRAMQPLRQRAQEHEGPPGPPPPPPRGLGRACSYD